jgi:5-(carboxyamino)imidazole ribonucleotide synthase
MRRRRRRPPAEVAAAFTRGAYDDEAALARFGAASRSPPYEFENIAAAPLDALAAEAPLYPPRARSKSRRIGSPRKQFVEGLGWTARPASPRSPAREELSEALRLTARPAILKTPPLRL